MVHWGCEKTADDVADLFEINRFSATSVNRLDAGGIWSDEEKLHGWPPPLKYDGLYTRALEKLFAQIADNCCRAAS